MNNTKVIMKMNIEKQIAELAKKYSDNLKNKIDNRRKIGSGLYFFTF